MTLAEVLDRLEAHYGPPAPPRVTKPFEMILLEALAYLASDVARERAFASLRKRVGTTPSQILAAPRAVLVEIARLGGIMAEKRADRLREIAELAEDEFDGKIPLTKKALMRFPGIGGPGAEKILLFTRTHPVLAMDSNAMRALFRLGFGEAKKSYASVYASVQTSADASRDCAGLIRAHVLLRRHGMTLCRRTDPVCEECPRVRECPFYAGTRRDPA